MIKTLDIELAPGPYVSIINVHLVDINVFAKFYEIPRLPCQDIEKPNRRGRTNGHENSIPPHKLCDNYYCICLTTLKFSVLRPFITCRAATIHSPHDMTCTILVKHQKILPRSNTQLYYNNGGHNNNLKTLRRFHDVDDVTVKDNQ